MEFYNFNYLENQKFVTDKFFLVVIILVIAFILFALYHYDNYRAKNNEEKVYKNSASVIKKLSEKFKVNENDIFINTPEITEDTVYKIKDKFYQIHWVGNNILVEQMTVPYVDEVKTIKE